MKSTISRLFFSLAIGLLVFGPAAAGPLDPPGPPAPTMVTLQQLYDRLNGIGVARTGQTGCYSAAGSSISCAGTGQDGAYQAGVSVSPRFTDNADGTVKDNLTGLIWLQDANCFGLQNWISAVSSANALASGSCGLVDDSLPGDWRLPNVRELNSLVDYSVSSGVLPAGHPFLNLQSGNYWSSTSYTNLPNQAWVGLGSGYTVPQPKSDARSVLPVRGGP